MYTHEETTAITDDLVLEGLGYTPGMMISQEELTIVLTCCRVKAVILSVWYDRLRLQRLDMVSHPTVHLITNLCLTCRSWTALAGSLVVGINSGGPPVIIWSWVGVSICSMAVAYSFAEICSAFPVAGGQYSWVAILAPAKYARPLSYCCGWFILIGLSSSLRGYSDHEGMSS